MRHLIDSYIGAEESRMLANFDDMSLVELLVEKGKEAIKDIPDSIKNNPDAMAEAIENNLRKVIIEESPTNPMYYEKMSVLLDELIKRRKEATLEYEKYLEEIIALSGKVKKPDTTSDYPSTINTAAKRALFDNLGRNEPLANELDLKILTTKKDGWRDNIQKSKAVRNAIKDVLKDHQIEDDNEVHRIFDWLKINGNINGANYNRQYQIDVVRKEIKNIHLAVYPPTGRVRIAAPLNVNEDAIDFAISKLGWIKKTNASLKGRNVLHPENIKNGKATTFRADGICFQHR